MRMLLRSLGLTLALLGAATLLASITRAATITVINLDGPGEGFNDPTPATPVGGNPGTTRGAQAFYVFQHAADLWAKLLPSTVEIRIEANFDSLDCDSVSGVLGSAAPNSIHSDFPNAPYPMTWYHQALANKLSGADQDPSADIGITFNSAIGRPNCIRQGWYFGVDGHEGGQIELLPVVLHEMGHGLGFSTSTIAGVEEVFPSIYDRMLLDHTTGLHWNEMAGPDRVASSMSCGELVWDGPNVKVQAPSFLGPKPLLRVNAPATVAGDYDVGLAEFGAPLSTSPVTGTVVLAQDAVGVPTNGCEPFTNAAQVSGHVALIDRGGCAFVVKAQNAQAAGAIAVVVADSAPGCPAIGMSGVAPGVTIPIVRITQDDGARLKSALLLGLSVSLLVDPTLMAGADPQGRVQLYTPLPYQTGSSVSHWDTAAEPSILMEPALNSNLSSAVDLTLPAFQDIGWFIGTNTGVTDAAKPRLALEPARPNPAPGAATIAWSLERGEDVQLTVFDLSGRVVAMLAQGFMSEGRHSVHWDGRDVAGRTVPAGVYRYRLHSETRDETRPLVIVR